MHAKEDLASSQRQRSNTELEAVSPKSPTSRLNNPSSGAANSSNEEHSHTVGYNGRWTDEEHNKFLDALRRFGKNWNKVHKYVGTRSSAQTRSHA